MSKEKRKKVIVVEDTPFGSNVFETIGEVRKQIGKTEYHKKRNPEAKTVFSKINKSNSHDARDSCLILPCRTSTWGEIYPYKQ